MSVTAIIGGQFGSEGKGLIVGHVAKDYDVHVRVGAANAGHTLYTWDAVDEKYGDKIGVEKHVMQQLPCAAYAHPDATLAIGPGAQISQDILMRELRLLRDWREARGLPLLPTIVIDPRAHIVQDRHINREESSDLAARIGSTSAIAREGIGAAQAARVMREELCVTVGDTAYFWEGEGLAVADVPGMLARADAAGERVLLEGTQGTGLSLNTGFFPYVTSRNTTAAGLAADCGVAPNAIERVIGVFRTYPIRVAGPSGPFYPDSEEIAWADIGVDSERERTTVTKKIRRVATWSQKQLWDACRINGVTDVALTFVDYLDARAAGRTEALESDAIADRVDDIYNAVGMSPRWIGTGPYSVIDLGDQALKAAA